MLLGLDVGFSKNRKSTGIAWLDENGSFGVARCGSERDDRLEAIPIGCGIALAALDGPLVPDGPLRMTVKRTAESQLSRGAFQRRCKPGSSHCGRGKDLRAAAHKTLGHIECRLEQRKGEVVAPFPFADKPVVEAFPNAFLGVMLPEACFPEPGKLKPGKKFDHLYCCAVRCGVFDRLARTLAGLPKPLVEAINAETDHEKRAAYVCLLTAASTKQGKVTPVGDAATGWITLPPIDIWARWAQNEMARQNPVDFAQR